MKDTLNIDDFRYMHAGVVVATLAKKDAALLSAINERSSHNQRAILLLHGFSSTPAVYRHLLPALANYDCVFGPILPGHSANLERFAKTTAADYISFTNSAYKTLSSSFKYVDVMGLSLGGLLACQLSASYPINHLYLLAPALDLPGWLNPQLILSKFFKFLGFREIPAYAGNLYTENFCELAYKKLPLSAIIELLTLIKQTKTLLPSCQTDLFLGRHDKVIAINRIEARFSNHKNITTHWLENSAHVLPLDGDIDTISACVQKNLNLPPRIIHPPP